MRIAISNIAWDVAEDDSIAQLLIEHQIDAIDIAPGKYFPDLYQARTADIHAVKHWWQDRGIEITGMQALLFGAQGLNMFGDSQSQTRMLDHLTAVCRIAGELSAPRLVFGSPKNRDRSHLNDTQAEEIALAFFARLAKIAQTYGVIICLEPNPISYSCNFMTTSPETSAIVRKTSHPNIKMHLDTGALTLNHENPHDIIKQHADIIGHIHASEPHLIPLGDGETKHHEVASALAQHCPLQLISIEMVSTPTEPHIHSIKRAVNAAISFYRSRALLSANF